MQYTFKIFNFFIFILVFFRFSLGFCQSDEEIKLLKLFYEDKELVVSSTRYPKPITEIPENITLISKEEIKALNAHTLADILERTIGISVQRQGGPGLPATAVILGNHSNKVKVMIDGIPVNNLSDNTVDVGSIPVQHIERIEIIKGPASNIWGSSLGGVINIITKSPSEVLGNNSISYSFGENNTQDLRLQLMGKKDNLGYYLYGGNFKSEGLTPNNDFYQNNLFFKTSYEFNNVNANFSLGYHQTTRQDGRDVTSDLNYSDDLEQLYSQLNINYKLDLQTELSLHLKSSIHNSTFFLKQLSSGANLQVININDKNYIGSLIFSTKAFENHHLVAGLEVEEGDLKSDYINFGKRQLNKFSIFVNDTIKPFPKLTVTPGVRYDYVSVVDNFVSPSIGVVYNVMEDSLIRAYASRGFGSPSLFQLYGSGFFFLPNKNLTMEKVLAYQLGFETSKIPYLWVKTTLFLFDIEDMLRTVFLPGGFAIVVNKDNVKQQGFELEFKTVPIKNFVLYGGFTLTDIRDSKTDEKIKGLPEYSVDLGLEYGERDNYLITLRGKYVWWNEYGFYNGKYENFIFDLHGYKKLFKRKGYTLEAFGSIRNLFNSSYYAIDVFKNPQRSLELGLKLFF